MDLLIALLTVPNSIVAQCFENIGYTAAKLTELAVIAEQGRALAPQTDHFTSLYFPPSITIPFVPL